MYSSQKNMASPEKQYMYHLVGISFYILYSNFPLFRENMPFFSIIDLCGYNYVVATKTGLIELN